MNIELFLCESIGISEDQFAQLVLLPSEPAWAVLNRRAADLLLNGAIGKKTSIIHGQAYNCLHLTEDSLDKMVNLLRNETGLPFAVCEQGVLSLLSSLPKSHTPLAFRKRQEIPEALKELWFHLTDSCNLHCEHCLFSAHLGKGRILPEQTILATIEEGCDLGVQLVVFTGGEPFTYPNFPALISSIQKHFPIKIAVLSNATLLERHARVLDSLDRDRLHLQISLDGPRHVHDAIRGKGAFDATIKGIELLKKLGIPFSIATALNLLNLDEMDHLFDLMVERDISNLHLMWHFSRGKGSRSGITPVNSNELQQIVLPKVLNFIRKAQALNIAIDNLDAITAQIFSPIGTAFATGNGGWDAIAIGPDAMIYPTPAMVDMKDLMAGHISEGLRNVWLNSQIFKKIRAISWHDIPGLTEDPWHPILGTGDLDHMILGEDKGNSFILTQDPYYPIYKAMAVMAIAREIPKNSIDSKDTPAVILRMGDVTSQCPPSKEINFTHCNCLLSMSSQDSQQLISEFYAKRAKKPDETIKNPLKLHDDALAFIPEEARIRMYGCGSPVLDAMLEQGETILDLGCGTGVECFLAARQIGRTGFVYGLDRLDEMLHIANNAKNQVIGRLGYDNIRFLKGDMESIPLPDECVDVVISNCVINLTRNKRKVFGEIFRVLKPGGRVIISDVVTDMEPSLGIRADHALSGECIAGAMVQDYLFDVLNKIGFTCLEILKRFPYRRIQDHWFHSLTFRAIKPSSTSNNRPVIVYKGPGDAIILQQQLLPASKICSLETELNLKPQELESRGILILDGDGRITNLSDGASCGCCVSEIENGSCKSADRIQSQQQVINTTGCLICGAPIKYFQMSQEMTCSVCQRVFTANSCCEKGHFVCDACHITNPMEVIRVTCLTSKETDMLALMKQIRSHQRFPMHGPEHHAMVPAIILTTYRNLGGNVNDNHIITALERGSKVPGGACGYMGVCGAAIGVGIGFSILFEASPITPAQRQRVQGIVSQVLQDISGFEAARCCQRDSYLALKAAERISLNCLPIGLKAQEHFVCKQYMRNKECVGRACPLHKSYKS